MLNKRMQTLIRKEERARWICVIYRSRAQMIRGC